MNSPEDDIWDPLCRQWGVVGRPGRRSGMMFQASTEFKVSRSVALQMIEEDVKTFELDGRTYIITELSEIDG